MDQPMCTLKIKFYMEDADLPAPCLAHDTDNGFDLMCNTDFILAPNCRQVVTTGVHVAIPYGYVGFVKDRSGLAAKSGVTTMAGVVDSGYRGEVRVVLLNTSGLPREFKRGDRVAQLVVLKCLVQSEVVNTLDELGSTDRGSNGFGSTGG